MAKDQPEKKQETVTAKIQIQEVKELELEKTEVKKAETVKNVQTVKQRIDAVVDKYSEDKEELKKQVFQLVQRILYPEQFCPDCDERMFFNPATSSYNCPNCGYQSAIQPTRNATTPIVNRPTGAVPPQVEKAIAEANESMKDTPIRPTALGDKIRKLVADRDAGGPAAPTKEDEARVKGSSKNVANKINWV
jgi:ribosomal protein L37AE/L43A